MRFRRSLRTRVAMAFAGVGGLAKLVFATGIYFASHNLEEQLIDDILKAELQDSIARYVDDSHFLLKATATIRGYVVGDVRSPPIPPQVSRLPPGHHHLTLEGILFRAMVANHAGKRFVVLYDESRLQQRERDFVLVLAVGVLVMTAASSLGGFWLAGRVIAPVTNLAARVTAVHPEDAPVSLAHHFPDDEVGELAHDFDAYLARLRAFIERERAFTGDVSHELRTPLAVIKGAVEMLLTEPELPTRMRGRIQRIARATTEITELTSALLIMAREEHHMAPPAISCDVEEVLLELVERLRELYRTKPVEVDLQINDRPCLPIERAVLAIVLGNLLRNAFAYTEQGCIDVILNESDVSITDTGIGIEADELPRVFERYHRGEHSQGAGIGLALVRRICDRFGWHIELHSEPGRGTRTLLVFHSQ